MAQVQWGKPQTGGIKPAPNAQNQTHTPPPYQPGGYYPPSFTGAPQPTKQVQWATPAVQPWTPPGYSGSNANATGGVEPSPWATPQIQTSTPLASGPTQGTGVSTGFQGSPTKWGYNFNAHTPQTGGVKPPQGIAGAPGTMLNRDPDNPNPLGPQPGPLGPGEAPSLPGPENPGLLPPENPGGGGTGGIPPVQPGPGTPTCKPGEVETSLDANGKLIPNGYECVSSEESWRRQTLYSNVPAGTPAPTPQNSGSPTPTSGSGGPPRNNSAFPTMPSGEGGGPAPEFNGPKWNAPEPFKAPTFNWNKELQAPEFTFNEGFDAPDFEFNGQFQAPTWNSPEAFTAPRLQWDEQWKAPSFEEAMSDPGYQFRLKEGMRALENNAAARGNLRTGATLKGLSDYAAESASQEYQNSYNRALEGYNTRLDTAKTKYGADFQSEEANFDKGMERERARYGAEFQGREAEFDKAFDVAKTKYGAKYQKAFDTYSQKYDLAKTKYGADYERAKDTYQSAFESFIAAFAANYQGKKDEYDSAFNAAKEDFDTKFATAQAEFNPKFTAWQTQQAAEQRRREMIYAAELERWKWNNPSANTIFSAGL